MYGRIFDAYIIMMMIIYDETYIIITFHAFIIIRCNNAYVDAYIIICIYYNILMHILS